MTLGYLGFWRTRTLVSVGICHPWLSFLEHHMYVIFVSMAPSGEKGQDSFQGTWTSATLVGFNADVMESQDGAVRQGENIFSSQVQVLKGYHGHVWHNLTLLNYVITWLMHLRPIDFVFLTKVSCSTA